MSLENNNRGNLTCSVLLGALLVFVFCGHAFAQDKILLKEGKTLHGQIIDETDTEVTLKFRSNMILRVDRKKIKKITRKSKRVRQGQIVTLDQVQEKEKKDNEQKAEGEKKEEQPEGEKKAEKKKEKKKKPEKVTLNNIEPGVKTQIKKKSNIQIIETVEAKVYAVRGRNFDTVYKSIMDRDKGKGFLNNRKRDASRTSLSLENKSTAKQEAGFFRWETVVLVATVTVESPSWSAPKNLKEDEIKKWNDYLLQLQQHDGGHADIYLRALKALSTSLSAYREKTEDGLHQKSAQALARTLKQTQKRQRGYDRRHPIKINP